MSRRRIAVLVASIAAASVIPSAGGFVTDFPNPPDIIAEADGPGGATVTFSPTATSDNPPVTVDCSPASGFQFALGQTTVNCTDRKSGV